MPFKVIQSVEKGKPVLTAVPHSWEKNGTLFWPKYQAEKLIKIEDICPEDNWIPIPCELKRDNLSNYDEAQVEINTMLYGGIAGHERNTRNRSDMEPSTSSKIVTYLPDPLAPAALSAVMELILENNRIMMENQHQMLKKLNEYSIKLDKLSTVSRHSENSCFETDTYYQDETFTPIDSVQALDDLEQELKDREKRDALYGKFTAICQGRGMNGAYFLIDMLFTRQFMTKCSWAGGSRGEETKVPFKVYNNVMSWFQEVVYNCDKTFSMIECHKFFKCILKNSIKRYESRGMRAPHRKRRRKQLQISYMNDIDAGDEYDERRDYKRRRVSEAEMSDGETDEEKE